MKRNRVISSLLQWIHSTELELFPAKQLPGKWRLFEYYTEPEGLLTNMKEEQINKENQVWEIHFSQDGQLKQITNLPVQFLPGVENCTC